jgi:hypothetical protein
MNREMEIQQRNKFFKQLPIKEEPTKITKHESVTVERTQHSLKTIENCLRISNDKCILCRPFFYVDELNQCSPCLDNCLRCSDQRSCVDCHHQFKLIKDPKLSDQCIHIIKKNQPNFNNCSKIALKTNDLISKKGNTQ